MIQALLHRPRTLWLRKIIFQIHLWLGLLIALYVVVIALSGSVLVFQQEIRQATLKQAAFDPSQTASLQTAISAAQNLHIGKLTYIALPQQPSPWWSFYLEDAHGKTRTIYADARTAQQLSASRHLFIDWVEDLHIYLLAGHSGFVVNCSLGICMLLVTLSGIVLWWPGIEQCKRALTICCSKGWKRMNYDLHHAVGFWTLLIVSWWSLTAIYFLFPAQVAGIVNRLSPLEGMKQPAPAAVAHKTETTIASPNTILQNAQRISPGFVSGISLPEEAGGNFTVFVDQRRPGDFSHRDVDVFDGHSGALLSQWHYGQNHTLGDWLLWLVYPLHFGTLWGLPVKILWSCLGLCLASLSLSGVLMYWNRVLARRFRARA